MTSETIDIEVAYATLEEQLILKQSIAPNATVETALQASGLLEHFPDIDLSVNKVGIFGKLCKLNTSLRPGDRIEVYRKLIADPKEARRKRAKESK
ncbi:MAG: RnfH family protein [Gammaproteobacteria bacterium]|nr:RnfH family protein [Gammaproteobacteria bacterium]